MRAFGTNFATLYPVITFFDIIIIYLACGTPFGVYFYVQNRSEKSVIPVLFGSLLRTFLWIPFGIRYFHSRITKKLPIFEFDNKSPAVSLLASKIENAKKSLEHYLLESGADISLFDFREILDRYCGLTIDLKEAQENHQEAEDLEVSKLSGHPNPALAAACIQRRNLIHLAYHQTLASKDLLKVFVELDTLANGRTDFRECSLELAMLLDDREFEKNLGSLYRLQTQTERDLPVNELENELWLTKKQTSKPAHHELKAVTATASFHKD